METYIVYFHGEFIFWLLKSLYFHLPRVHILGKNHIRKELRFFYFVISYRDVKCRRYYLELSVVGFVTKIKSDYYGVNI